MMGRLLASAFVLSVLGVTTLSAQITSYIDERGRKVYVNADETPQRQAHRKKAASRSVLVRRDSRTGQFVRVPSRADREGAAQAVSNGEASEAQAQPAERRPRGAGQQAPEQAAVERAGSGAGGDPAQTADSGKNGEAESVANRHTRRRTLDSLITEMAERHSLDPDLVRALIKVESNFNPVAVSHKGAMGLMQLIPRTARALGVRDVFDPKENLEGGMRHLRYLLDRYNGNLRLSLAAYNAGEGAVGRYQGVPPYRETQHYVRKVSTLYSNGAVSAPDRLVEVADTGTPKEPERVPIVRWLDERGRIHFSNTEAW